MTPNPVLNEKVPVASADEWIVDPIGELVSQLLPETTDGPPLNAFHVVCVDRMAGCKREFICQAADAFAALSFCLKRRLRVWRIERA